jgi:hypothetical protein
MDVPLSYAHNQVRRKGLEINYKAKVTFFKTQK